MIFKSVEGVEMLFFCVKLFECLLFMTYFLCFKCEFGACFADLAPLWCISKAQCVFCACFLQKKRRIASIYNKRSGYFCYFEQIGVKFGGLLAAFLTRELLLVCFFGLILLPMWLFCFFFLLFPEKRLFCKWAFSRFAIFAKNTNFLRFYHKW